jgi:hypothetical protein
MFLWVLWHVCFQFISVNVQSRTDISDNLKVGGFLTNGNLITSLKMCGCFGLLLSAWFMSVNVQSRTHNLKIGGFLRNVNGMGLDFCLVRCQQLLVSLEKHLLSVTKEVTFQLF